jgi:hypothetical protein
MYGCMYVRDAKVRMYVCTWTRHPQTYMLLCIIVYHQFEVKLVNDMFLVKQQKSIRRQFKNRGDRLKDVQKRMKTNEDK